MQIEEDLPIFFNWINGVKLSKVYSIIIPKRKNKFYICVILIMVKIDYSIEGNCTFCSCEVGDTSKIIDIDWHKYDMNLNRGEN